MGPRASGCPLEMFGVAIFKAAKWNRKTAALQLDLWIALGKGARLLRLPKRCRRTDSNKFSRIQNAVRIERGFDSVMQVLRFLGDRLRPPAFFSETNTVLASDRAAARNHPAE